MKYLSKVLCWQVTFLYLQKLAVADIRKQKSFDVLVSKKFFSSKAAQNCPPRKGLIFLAYKPRGKTKTYTQLAFSCANLTMARTSCEIDSELTVKTLKTLTPFWCL